jgi:FixJ family two-component response regulator
LVGSIATLRRADANDDPKAWEAVNRFKNRLTPREVEVLYYVMIFGWSKDVAKRLGLSLRTVEIHRDNIHRKLKVGNVVQLVRKTFGIEHEKA